MATDVDDLKVISDVRDYLMAHFSSSINLNDIARAVNLDAAELNRLVKTGEELLEKIILLERNSIQSYFKELRLETMSALDTLIIVGQEVFDRFQHISPGILANLKTSYPNLFESLVKPYLIDISNQLKKNLLKGVDEGYYRIDIDVDATTQNFLTDLMQYHESNTSTFVHFSFGMIFNNLFERFINEVTTPEGWQYFMRRRQFIEAIDFGHLL